ncbi:RRM domain-containing protein [Favolaschia claudopus]|uniref:RRM domain-containing protein n=1 Tax=Favolaschia claudopus TaxID=2862362 RepID=A0AAW0D0C7_9AGAR
MVHTPSLSGPIFKFSRETNAVSVENIPQNVNRLEALALFSTLIGDIRTSRDSDDALEITFFTADSARKALCMNGYNIAGSPLVVSPVVRAASPLPSHGGQQVKRTDTRRNLYVLGVPFGMTNQSLAALFTPHGTVSHCVILATLDSASRRRGFVVMSSHEEARQAMAALGRTSKTGNGMDISWAVVQRSKGFLDGGDRAGIAHPPPGSLPSPPVPEEKKMSPEQALPILSAVPTQVLLLANLPSLLFGSEDDLRGLVCPFGIVKSLRIVHLPDLVPSAISGSLMFSTTHPASKKAITAAIVHYTSFNAAQDASRALNGESYAGCTVRAVYLVDPEAEPASVPDSPLLVQTAFSTQNNMSLANYPLCRSFAPAAASHCGPSTHKPLFDGRNVGNQVLTGVEHGFRPLGRQYRSPELLQQQFYATVPFPQFESPSTYGANELLSSRWNPDTVYVRTPSRDIGYYV